MMRDKVSAEAVEARAAKLRSRERAKLANLETEQANSALRDFKLKEEEREREVDRAIESYAASKAETLAERKRREAARAAAMETKRMAMVHSSTAPVWWVGWPGHAA
jgi:hypothetical protein